jgi:NmrA-like family
MPLTPVYDETRLSVGVEIRGAVHNARRPVAQILAPYRPLISSGELPPSLDRARLLAPAAIRSTKAQDRSRGRRDCAPRLARAKTTIRSTSSALFPLSSPNWTHDRAPRSASAEVVLSPTLLRCCPFSKIGIMNDGIIVVAGATGNLGGRIVRALVERGASVKALVRHGTAQDKLERLQGFGVTIASVDWTSASQLTPACSGASCVVSALQGLQEVIVETQTVLLEGAIQAGVPRFIPSDYSIDFTKFPPGENRNLDLRRDFHKRLDKTSISATTIFSGAFADMLTGQMPLILFKLKRVLYWGDADQRMGFTTMDDTASFTASAALDPSTPRFCRRSAQRPGTDGGRKCGDRKGVPSVPRRRSGNARRVDQGRAHGRSRREGTLPGMAGHAVHA